eukprot:TRINITY_DN26676_c0_g1_i1.p1 TRINITY_DN26676_c0_g1~~TRINITY_DN26676_c0_g1_i1.p1  ORF type:complete len:391 (+),score=68.19 TRINITY_DN26676_c0_g1_i1:155-1327(+)
MKGLLPTVTRGDSKYDNAKTLRRGRVLKLFNLYQRRYPCLRILSPTPLLLLFVVAGLIYAYTQLPLLRSKGHLSDPGSLFGNHVRHGQIGVAKLGNASISANNSVSGDRKIEGTLQGSDGGVGRGVATPLLTGGGSSLGLTEVLDESGRERAKEAESGNERSKETGTESVGIGKKIPSENENHQLSATGVRDGKGELKDKIADSGNEDASSIDLDSWSKGKGKENKSVEVVSKGKNAGEEPPQTEEDMEADKNQLILEETEAEEENERRKWEGTKVASGGQNIALAKEEETQVGQKAENVNLLKVAKARSVGGDANASEGGENGDLDFRIEKNSTDDDDEVPEVRALLKDHLNLPDQAGKEERRKLTRSNAMARNGGLSVQQSDGTKRMR